ncbi:uncharacterized protein LAJ45_03351 [Morchella importuna]|uniref:uncharacterized protein n=1 Tax=Morchella importuna TaxID=1174673 RepID=UPI001E8EC413|nr:uncharacterized protein LAJ45_03351 [Morchella importuna]KAH8152511.1 hypothetical protein LAJ45_03351 [Morchella importuna]
MARKRFVAAPLFCRTITEGGLTPDGEGSFTPGERSVVQSLAEEAVFLAISSKIISTAAVNIQQLKFNKDSLKTKFKKDKLQPPQVTANKQK